jgi:hypothetical protein
LLNVGALPDQAGLGVGIFRSDSRELGLVLPVGADQIDNAGFVGRIHAEERSEVSVQDFVGVEGDDLSVTFLLIDLPPNTRLPRRNVTAEPQPRLPRSWF